MLTLLASTLTTVVQAFSDAAIADAKAAAVALPPEAVVLEEDEVFERTEGGRTTVCGCM